MTMLASETETHAHGKALQAASTVALSATLLASLLSAVGIGSTPPHAPDVLVADQQTDTPAVDALRLGDRVSQTQEIEASAAHGSGTATARFFDDVLVAKGGVIGSSHDTLVGMDRDSGEELWRHSRTDAEADGMTLDLGDELLEHAGEHIYLEYDKELSDGQEEVGVLALSPKDGEVAWKVPLGTAPRYDRDVEITDSQDDRLLIDVTDDAPEPERAVMVDVSDGEIAWESDKLSAHVIAGDLVVGVDAAAPQSLVAVDIADGKRQWDLETDIALAATDDRTLVGITGGMAIVDNDTGDVATRFAAPDASCAAVGQRSVVCQTEVATSTSTRYYPLVVDMEGETAQPCVGPGATYLAWADEDRVSTVAASHKERPITFDHECNVVDDKLPGAVLDIAGDYAALAVDDSVAVYELHAS